eukprot:3165278-Lingulodinium_polyedra.AAC.1
MDSLRSESSSRDRARLHIRTKRGMGRGMLRVTAPTCDRGRETGQAGVNAEMPKRHLQQPANQFSQVDSGEPES